MKAHRVSCPYCGETFEALLDTGEHLHSGESGFDMASIEYYEDCYVCCRPILFHLTSNDLGELEVRLRRDDE